jgi:hypothetical protein
MKKTRLPAVRHRLSGSGNRTRSLLRALLGPAGRTAVPHCKLSLGGFTMKLRLSAVLLVLCTAIPTFARVLSYSPYTNQVAMPGFHERTTRHFLLLETTPGAELFDPHSRELVLYDTQGEDPRVVIPKSAVSTLYAAALYEHAPPILAPIDAPPVVTLLAVVVDNNGTAKTLVSGNAGTTWKEVEALRGKVIDTEPPDEDHGGPWVQGLYNPIRTGNPQWPFIVRSWSHGIWAVAADGRAQALAGPQMTLVGQSADGTKLLVTEYLSPVGTKLSLQILHLNTGVRELIAADFYAYTTYTGWISPDGTAYIVATRDQGRFLYKWRVGQLELIAGPRDVVAPPYNGPGNGQSSAPANNFLAVPTHDFDGAWMIQRGAFQPTRLLRYTAGSGLSVLWTDPAAPEVEALIAGRSGQSVLIQVHRDRSVEQVPFIDPALAVWKLGEPMPRDYDELYVNEEQNKGFIHVDPDTMRDGSKFVFNSGSFENSIEEGPVSPPIGGGGDVIQEWGVVQASLKQHLILPGVARLQGGFGSEWRTDVTMYNPLDTEQNVDVEYVPMYEAASSHRTVTVTLKAHEIRFVPDALQALFLLENGGGALHFRPAVGMNVVGRTYSRSGEGTYGFGMTAIDAFNAAGPRFPMTFAGAFPGEHFRTNILLTDTSGGGAAAELSAFGVSGSIGSTGSIITALAGGTSQANGIHSTLNLFQRDAGGLMIQATRGTAIATVVAIDNRTNDPTWFPPDLTATEIRTIPVIGHLPGANGSQFRSDIYLFNPTSQTRTVVLEAKKWDSPVLVTRQFTLLPREARVVVDALYSLWNLEGVARLRYWTTDEGDGVRVTSRTYTIEESGATYGSLIPPLNNFQTAPAGDALEIIGATAGPGFRTNLGLVELSPVNFSAAPTTVRIRIIDQDHRELDNFTILLQRAGGIQINNILAARGITPPPAALLVVEVLTNGLVGAYATLVDNVTNDTTYLGAQLAAKP